MGEMIQCASPNCRATFQATDTHRKRLAEDPSSKFFCASCRKAMADQRIANKMGWVKK